MSSEIELCLRYYKVTFRGQPLEKVLVAGNEASPWLAEYMAVDQNSLGATSESYNVGPITVSTSRNAAWMARAMVNSGAADLLRPYRRAA